MVLVAITGMAIVVPSASLVVRCNCLTLRECRCIRMRRAIPAGLGLGRGLHRVQVLFFSFRVSSLFLRPARSF
eukprot:6211372-Alexandrium_andersonii.AAC.1